MLNLDKEMLPAASSFSINSILSNGFVVVVVI